MLAAVDARLLSVARVGEATGWLGPQTFQNEEGRSEERPSCLFL